MSTTTTTAVIDISIPGQFCPLAYPPQDGGTTLVLNNNSPWINKGSFALNPNAPGYNVPIIDGATAITVGATGSLAVKTAMALKFRFTDASPASANLAAFYPVGIGFYKKGAGSQSSVGVKSLSRENISYGYDSGQTFPIPWIQLMNEDLTDDAGSPLEYYLIIQDCWGSFGAIDPEIDNQPE